ncbi:hypothetical protein Tco_0842811 [Tanacetum coccineum]|uniref:Uncharacterized protein n=1 Tax=Tanacetum coccineum TaxID=301880 RepID=A0ABQ5B608_9ASTR
MLEVSTHCPYILGAVYTGTYVCYKRSIDLFYNSSDTAMGGDTRITDNGKMSRTENTQQMALDNGVADMTILGASVGYRWTLRVSGAYRPLGCVMMILHKRVRSMDVGGSFGACILELVVDRGYIRVTDEKLLHALRGRWERESTHQGAQRVNSRGERVVVGGDARVLGEYSRDCTGLDIDEEDTLLIWDVGWCVEGGWEVEGSDLSCDCSERWALERSIDSVLKRIGHIVPTTIAMGLKHTDDVSASGIGGLLDRCYKTESTKDRVWVTESAALRHFECELETHKLISGRCEYVVERCHVVRMTRLQASEEWGVLIYKWANRDTMVAVVKELGTDGVLYLMECEVTLVIRYHREVE